MALKAAFDARPKAAVDAGLKAAFGAGLKAVASAWLKGVVETGCGVATRIALDAVRPYASNNAAAIGRLERFGPQTAFRLILDR